MKTIVREISKDESQKWGNIARIRCIDGEFDQKVEAREKEAFEKIEKAKKDAERLMVERMLMMQMMFSPLRHALMNRSPVQMEWIPTQSWQGKSR